MTHDLLSDLAEYKSHREKAVSMAARSLIGVYRQTNPSMLRKKDRVSISWLWTAVAYRLPRHRCNVNSLLARVHSSLVLPLCLWSNISFVLPFCPGKTYGGKR
jgi:hypothetical protein